MKKVRRDVVATFSIVGFDPETGELGIAVQSKFLGVGAVVPWAQAGVGAIATQSYANTSYGPRGLELLATGKAAGEVMQLLTESDEERELRQVGIVDAKGNAATYTGASCYDWAGGRTGKHYAAQGNILVSEQTVRAMAQAYEETAGTLADRLLAALQAGQDAGGDSRGKQSAALLVVKEAGGYGGFNDRYIDLRVDDHAEPIRELVRIYHLQQLYFAESKRENITVIEGPVKEELIYALRELGYLQQKTNASITEEDLHNALTTYIHTENFENRKTERGKIDMDILTYMKKQFS